MRNAPWSDWQQLPAPHDAISVSVQRFDGNQRNVRYYGASLEALHAAGCLDDVAFARFSQTRERVYGAAVCAAGEWALCRRKRIYGETRSGPKQWEITWQASTNFAHTLPGVAGSERRADKPDGHRMRSVGRLQRPLRWTARGDVIYIDWQSVQSAAISKRDLHA